MNYMAKTSIHTATKIFNCNYFLFYPAITQHIFLWNKWNKWNIYNRHVVFFQSPSSVLEIFHTKKHTIYFVCLTPCNLSFHLFLVNKNSSSLYQRLTLNILFIKQQVFYIFFGDNILIIKFSYSRYFLIQCIHYAFNCFNILYKSSQIQII